MTLLKKIEYKIQKFSVLDISLAKLMVVFITLLAVKQFPTLLNLDTHWYFIGAVFLSVKPLRTMFRAKYQNHTLLLDE
ncbi:MAG: hypothetical protein HRU03_02675 [Nanoarchaeales archaeon]|nr:hypothetical protein [Nanoarchaeales archaeon]